MGYGGYRTRLPLHTILSFHDTNQTEMFHFVLFVQVFRYQIFTTCSQYNTCVNCTALRDPLCGWCVVENKCSSTDHCYSSELAGRWVYTHEQCIVNVSLSSMYAALDNLSHVSFPGAFAYTVYSGAGPGGQRKSIFDYVTMQSVDGQNFFGEMFVLIFYTR